MKRLFPGLYTLFLSTTIFTTAAYPVDDETVVKNEDQSFEQLCVELRELNQELQELLTERTLDGAKDYKLMRLYTKINALDKSISNILPRYRQ